MRIALIAAFIIFFYSAYGQGWYPTGPDNAESTIAPNGPNCWSGGFSAKFCCDKRRGPRGNTDCWGGGFTYEVCCGNKESPPERGPTGQTPYHHMAMAYFIATAKSEHASDFRLWMEQADLYEFGVYIGWNLHDTILWLSTEGLHFHSLFGFDSFQGIPDADELFPSGDWSAQRYYNIQDVPTLVDHINVTIGYANTRLIAGYYNESLVDTLPSSMGMRKAFWINVDCDTYTSTLEALDFIFRNSLAEPGKTLMYLDDGWYYQLKGQVGELEALDQIKHKYGVETTTLMRTPPWDGRVGYLFRVESVTCAGA